MNDGFYQPSGLVAWIDYRWRQFATGLAFVLFGCGGLLFGPLILPFARLGGGGEARMRQRVQRNISRGFRLFSRVMRGLGLIRWEIHGAEKLRRQGQMIIANHPSLIDVVLLLGYIPETDCIVKEALFRNPVTRRAASWAGYISNSTPSQLVADCTKSLKQGRSLLIFPEGTRSVPGEPVRIPHAAARIALESGAEILPVSIRCEPIMLYKHCPWYRVPAAAGHWTITVGDHYRADRYLEEAPNMAIAARRLTRQWETWFIEHLQPLTDPQRTDPPIDRNNNLKIENIP